MKTLDSILDYIQKDSELILTNTFQFTAILSGVLVFAYKKTKSIKFIDILISFIFCMISWNAIKSIIPNNYTEFYIVFGWIFGAASNKIVEFILNIIIVIGKKAEEYAKKKIDEYTK